MKNITCFILLFILPTLLIQCKKKDHPEPLEQLPPITQSGANTIGCLLNGKAWTLKGNNGTSNYSVSFDPTFDGGTFDLRTYRYPDKSGKNQYLILNAFHLSSTGTHFFTNRRSGGVSYTDHKTNCQYESYDSLITYSTGSITIAKLDLKKGIISDTFEFTLAKSGCDTIKVTKGRFDKKL